MIIYRAVGSIHPDHPHRLAEIILRGDEESIKYNRMWGELAPLAKRAGWAGHCKVGPFAEGDGLIWDDGSGTVWLAFPERNEALENGSLSWKPTTRTQVVTEDIGNPF